MQNTSSLVEPPSAGPADAELRAGQRVGGGRYCLNKVVGQGGPGAVWLAWDEKLDTQVALKFLPAQLREDTAAVDDLKREIVLVQKLNHPSIVRIHDLCDAPGHDIFISMEYVDGCHLTDLRTKRTSCVFAWSFLNCVAEQLCAGLEHAHAAQVFHGDLKPTHLILDTKGRLRITEFGVARIVREALRRNSLESAKGSMPFMSPQQVEGLAPQASDDIYSLGASLFELLTGQTPLDTDRTAIRPIQQRLNELKLENEVSEEVERVIMACRSREPSQRPQSVAEVADLLNLEPAPMPVVTEENQRMESIEAPARRPWGWIVAAALAIGFTFWTIAEKRKNAQQLQRTQIGGASGSARVTPPPAEDPTNVAAVKPTTTAPVAVTDAPPAAVPTPQPVKPVATTPPAPPPVTTTPKPAEVATTVAPAPRPRPPEPAKKKGTALQLVADGNAYVSERSKDRVLQIISERGPIEGMPQEWRILYFDEKASRNSVEVRFEKGEMVRMHEPSGLLNWFSPGAQKTLDLTKVKIDSPEAIRLAASELSVDGTTPKSVEMKLERGNGGAPVWNVKVFGVAEKSSDEAALGSVVLLAEDGKVLKKETAVRKTKVTAPKQGK